MRAGVVLVLGIGIASLLFAAPALGAPCDRLAGEKKALAEKLFRSTYPYECCDETLDRCLKQKQVCKLAKRLRDDICRRVARGEDEKRIKSGLERRARSMTPGGKKAVFDLSRSTVAGDPRGKLVVVACACARCPFCSKVVPELHRIATASSLKGKIALYFRPFPISSHKGSLEGGLAMVAAEKLKRFWPYLLKLYAEYDRFSVERLLEWAGAVGIDKAAFQKEIAEAATRAALVESKKEGIRNGVDATPTIFIGGQKYHGDLDNDSLLDVLDEAVDRIESRQFCGAK
jgi:protein-disulfide isomerase